MTQNNVYINEIYLILNICNFKHFISLVFIHFYSYNKNTNIIFSLVYPVGNIYFVYLIYIAESPWQISCPVKNMASVYE